VNGDGLAHLFGDYVVQSDWMAADKLHDPLAAAAHAATYAACFLPVTRNPRAIAVIGLSHFVIDRWRLARYVCWVKNQAAPARYRYPWSHARKTGYHDETEHNVETLRTRVGTSTDMASITQALRESREPGPCAAPAKPAWLAVWLMIIADNTIHLAINRWALRRWSS
jgi:hypothetical protein